MWRELKAAAVYEVVPTAHPAPVAGPQERPSLQAYQAYQAYQATHAPAWALAPADQAARITYFVRTEAYATWQRPVHRTGTG